MYPRLLRYDINWLKLLFLCFLSYAWRSFRHSVLSASFKEVRENILSWMSPIVSRNSYNLQRNSSVNRGFLIRIKIRNMAITIILHLLYYYTILFSETKIKRGRLGSLPLVERCFAALRAFEHVFQRVFLPSSFPCVPEFAFAVFC